jgi:hypothetical protein
MPSAGGSASASASKGSGSSNVELDAETRAFRDSLFNNFNNITGNIFDRYPDGAPDSFIPDFSADTQDYFSGVRNLQTPGAVNPNLANFQGVNAYTFNNPAYQQAATFDNPAYQQAAMVDNLAYTSGYQGKDFLNQYLDPALGGYVNDTLADYDTGVARQLNQMQAGRDAGVAFGDRAANADAVFRADAQRGRGALSGNLRSDAYKTAIGAGQTDASRLTGINSENAGITNQARFTNAATQNAVNAANTGIANQTGLYNTGIQNQVNAANTGIQNQLGQYNTNILNDAERYNVGGANANSQFNTGIQNQFLQNNDTNAWNRQLQSLGLLSGVGGQIDARNEAVAREPLDLLGMAGSLLAGVPYGTNTTNKSKASSKSGTITG